MRAATTLAFWRELAAALRCRLPVPAAVGEAAAGVAEAEPRAALTAAAARVAAGQSLHEALTAARCGLPRDQLLMVRLGEDSGQLLPLIEALSPFAANRGECGRSLRLQATQFLLVAGLIQVPVALGAGRVIPFFRRMFVEMLGDEPLPRLTRVVVGLAAVIQPVSGALMWLGALCLAAALVCWLCPAPVERALLGITAWLAGAGGALAALDGARLCTILRARQAAGLPDSAWFDIPPAVFGTAHFRRRLADWQRRAKAGVALAGVFGAEPAAGQPEAMLTLAFASTGPGRERDVELVGTVFAVRAAPAGAAGGATPLFLAIIGFALGLGLVVLALLLPLLKLTECLC